MRPALLLALCAALAACKEDAARPAALVMTDDALGHYCQMYLADHAGPKAQVFLDGYDRPVWFAQVADAAAYRTDPERPAPVAVVYVSDMGAAASWEVPGTGNWIDATTAHFVVDSDRTGGMGLPEAIPFGAGTDAAAFAAAHGGRVVGWADVPDDLAGPAMAGMTMDGGTTDGPNDPPMTGHDMALQGEAQE